MTAGDVRTGRVEQLVASISLPQPFTLQGFVESVAQMRGKRIELIRTLSAVGPCGLLLSTSTADYIFYDGSSPLHRDHNVLHEIGHLLLGHRLAFADLRALDAPLTEQQRSPGPRVTSPVEHGSAEEREADQFAALILARLPIVAASDAESAPGLWAGFALGAERSVNRWNWSSVRRGVANCVLGVLAEYGVRTCGGGHG